MTPLRSRKSRPARVRPLFLLVPIFSVLMVPLVGPDRKLGRRSPEVDLATRRWYIVGAVWVLVVGARGVVAAKLEIGAGGVTWVARDVSW